MSEELKKAYQEKVEAQLKEWADKVKALKNKAAGLGADAKIKTLEKIEDLKGKIKESSDHLSQLKDSGENEWEKLKEKIEGIGEGIKKTIDEMMSNK
jgi:DNA-binding ferritin-like protein